MGALAGLVRQLGHEVTGSDLHFDPPMGPALERWGVRCVQGFDARHLEPRPDLVVVGNVCRKDNVEAVAAFAAGLRVTHIAGALRELALANTAPLVVAGTHGKTTTTALASFLLDRCGYAPGFLVGGLPLDFGTSARPAVPRRSLPQADGPQRRVPFVIEGDEYDTAYFEKTAKFLHYGAEVAIITSVEHDHIDIYPTFDDYRAAFAAFIAGVPEQGLVIAHAGSRQVVELVRAHAKAPIAWYALEGEDTHGEPPHWLAAPLPSKPEGTAFDLYAGGVYVGRLQTRLSGRHNIANATAALAACAQGYGAKLHELGRALADFQGVARRQQVLGRPGGITVIDDFAHHPTAVAETLAGLRARYSQGRLWAVFEPRSATACRRTHQQAYATAFSAADQILLAPVGRPNLPPEERLDLALLASDLENQGKNARALPSIDAILETLAGEARSGDTIALLSNGSFGGIHARLLGRLAAELPPSRGADK